MVNLQGIIGTDAHNPYVSVYCNPIKNELHIYHGMSLFDVIPNIKNSIPHKLLAVQLYNANVKTSIISKHLGYCYRSVRKWSKVLKTGSAEEIVKIMEGQGAPRKFTKEIEGFAAYEFNKIYPKNKKSYSKEIRKSIEEVFRIKLAPETLRPLFTQLREKYKQTVAADFKKKQRL